MELKKNTMNSEMDWTGERLETFIFNDITIEHLHRYAIAQEFVKDKIVLDIASGAGYGSNLLAANAKEVIGVDISLQDIENSKVKYEKTSNLSYCVGSVLNIPFENNKFDVVVSFETLEHITEHDLMIYEIKRVLKTDGILIISTPDKLAYSDIPQTSNIFHKKELYTNEFVDLVSRFFKNHNLLNQKILNGSLVYNNDLGGFDKLYEGNYDKINHSNNILPVYNIIIASDYDLINIKSSFFKSPDSYYYNQIIKKIQSSNSYKLGNFLLSPLIIFKKLFKIDKNTLK